MRAEDQLIVGGQTQENLEETKPWSKKIHPQKIEACQWLLQQTVGRGKQCEDENCPNPPCSWADSQAEERLIHWTIGSS
jgi:hypothetical protein